MKKLALGGVFVIILARPIEMRGVANLDRRKLIPDVEA